MNKLTDEQLAGFRGRRGTSIELQDVRDLLAHADAITAERDAALAECERLRGVVRDAAAVIEDEEDGGNLLKRIALERTSDNFRKAAVEHVDDLARVSEADVVAALADAPLPEETR